MNKTHVLWGILALLLGVGLGWLIPKGGRMEPERDMDVWKTALLCAEISEAVYDDDRLLARLAELGFPNATPISHESLNAVVCSNDAMVVVSFRGTDDLRDWIVNANVTGTKVSDGPVHEGFYKGTTALYDPVLGEVRKYGGDKKPVYVTGHSLGGAMSVLFCYEALVRKDIEIHSLITFGQPLTMGRNVAHKLNELLGTRYRRFVNGRDIVTRLVPTFWHAGTRIHLSADGLTMGQPVVTIRSTDRDAGSADAEAMTMEAFRELQRDLSADTEAGTSDESVEGVTPRGRLPWLSDHSMTIYSDRIRRFGIKLETELDAETNRQPDNDSVSPATSVAKVDDEPNSKISGSTDVRNPRGIALTIGLNRVDPVHYGDTMTLRGCVNDANDMFAITQGKRFECFEPLLDEKATRAEVSSTIKKAADELTSGDIFFVHYSGHGASIADHNGDESDGRDETWCLYDGMMIDDELHRLWCNFRTGVRIVVFSDSCYSGTVTRGNAFSAAIIAGDSGGVRGAPGVLDPDNAEGMVFRFIPDEIADATVKRNSDFYDRVFNEISKVGDEKKQGPDGDRPTVRASVLLISGCQDNQVSADLASNGLFTSAVKRIWSDGRFGGSWRTFHAKVVSIMPQTQSPNFFPIGVSNAGFWDQKPFTINAR